MTETLPELDHFSGSWIVTRKADSSVVGEFYSRDIVSRFNPNTCHIETTLQYLNRINRDFKKEDANATDNDARLQRNTIAITINMALKEILEQSLSRIIKKNGGI